MTYRLITTNGTGQRTADAIVASINAGTVRDYVPAYNGESDIVFIGGLVPDDRGEIEKFLDDNGDVISYAEVEPIARLTKSGAPDKRAAAGTKNLTAYSEALGPEGRSERARKAIATRWSNSNPVTMEMVVSSIDQVRSICRRLNRKRWAVTPETADHTHGTFTVGTSPEISGTWRVE